MSLGLRSFIPYALPGALAMVGCWWLYRSHHTPHVTIHDGEEKKPVDLLASSPTVVSSVSSHLPKVSEQDIAMEPEVELIEPEKAENEQESLETSGLQMKSALVCPPKPETEEPKPKLEDPGSVICQSEDGTATASRISAEETKQSRGSDVSNIPCSVDICSKSVWEAQVPKSLVSRFIGIQGWHVKALKKTSGAKIHIITVPKSKKFDICHVEGTKQQVDSSVALISKWFSQHGHTLTCFMHSHRCHSRHLTRTEPDGSFEPCHRGPQDTS